MFAYEGDDITIEEMPQGCVIANVQDDGITQQVVIASTRDAIALILSLTKMVNIQMGELE